MQCSSLAVALALGLALTAPLAGCGDDNPADADAAAGDATPPDGGEADILDLLAALPGVTVSEWVPPADWHGARPGYRYINLWFTTPVDHQDPEAGTFQQYVGLMHHDVLAPMVAYTSGYDAGFTIWLTEPAEILDANQISIEYRFYADSRPEIVDWSKLTVAQAAADEHAILAALGTIYTGAVITTGGSKGGETALQHYRLYPDDVDGVIAYVAPVITDMPDLRYAGVLDEIGLPACRDKLRAVQSALLEDRVDLEAMVLAADDATYDHVGVAHATETAVVELEFAFWMTRGEADCDAVPDAGAGDATLYQFLVETSGPAAYGDADLAVYGSQYIYQDMLELGYPVWMHEHLDDLMQFSYEDWSAYLPADVETPVLYDPAAPRDLADWIETDAERILLVNGEWDPWSPGAPAVAADVDSYSLWVPHGSHWSTGIYSLGEEDAITAVAALERWGGVTGRSSSAAPAGAAAARLRAHPPRAPMASHGPTLDGGRPRR
jgi:hypothetical protein